MRLTSAWVCHPLGGRPEKQQPGQGLAGVGFPFMGLVVLVPREGG
jgi:hypothetical protein